MARIPDAFIDDLLARSDIVEIVGARVPLKKQGREYSARCPFHDERSPSFTVSPTKQFYHCFGCGAHGTAIIFLMNYDRMEFLDAVEDLAKLTQEIETKLGKNGRVLIRASGTEPLVRIMIEGQDEQSILDQALSLAHIIVRKYNGKIRT